MEGISVTPLEDFLDKQNKLIQMERQAEIAVVEETITGRPLRELVANGLALWKLHIVGVKGAMGHRKNVQLTTKNRQPMPSHKFGSGDTVTVSCTSTPENVLGEGIVCLTGETTISVVLDEFAVEDTDFKTFCILPAANDVTFNRLARCLVALEEYERSPGRNLVEYLFGKLRLPALSGIDIPLSMLDDCINSSQERAVRMCVNSTQPISVIHGPPGTGKTRTIVEIIRQSVAKGVKVLVCCPSNVAVDNVVERIAGHVKVIRMGHPARSHPHCSQYTLDHILAHSQHATIASDIRQQMESCVKNRKWTELRTLRKELTSRENQASKQLLSCADVICSTLTSCSTQGPLRVLKDRGFDLIIIDECAQSIELACWIGILQARRVVLAGDHKQLPPTVILPDAEKSGLSVSLMDRIYSEFGALKEEMSVMLDTQYRMNERISQWVSQNMYNNLLIAHQSVTNHSIRDIVPGIAASNNEVLNFIDTDGCDMSEITTLQSESKANPGEVKLVYLLVRQLIEAGCKQDYISIISPYNLQVSLLKKHISNDYPQVNVRSVDGFQGQESEVVIISLVRSNKRGEVGFLADHRRINVAVSRARRQLLVVGDSTTLERDSLLKSLLQHIHTHGNVIHAHQFQNDLDDLAITVEPVGAIFDPGQSKKSVTKGQSAKETKQKREKPAKEKIPVAKLLETNNKQDIEFDSDEEDDLPNKDVVDMQDLVGGFVKSDREEMELPVALNSFQRMLVHEIAENHGLQHHSTGNANNRRLVLVKSAIASETSNRSREVSCESVADLHANSTDAGIDLVKQPIVAKATKPKRKPKNKKKCEENDLTAAQNDDELLDSLIANVHKCRLKDCNGNTALMGITCKFCKFTFCLTHGMAEIHGCGVAVKSAARSEMRQTIVGGIIQPRNVRTDTSVKNKEKHKLLQQKLEKNLQESQTGRKKQTKNK